MFSDTFRNTFSAYVTRHEENDSSRDQEHMFNKVVTPSDVGKLNRLVIPKQCAEKYFPLDSSINEKGKILNFEDKYGKSWRFRYSYWNSSQSYVMTKGWSRFVKEKRLEAGDTVTFSRGLNKDRFYIDYKRRSNALNRTTLGNLVHPLTLSRLVLPSPVIPTISINSFLHPFYSGNYGVVHHGSPVLLENRPVTHQKVAPKRVRLFGVNLDCPDDDEKNRNGGGYVDYSSPHSFVSGISHGGNLPRKEKEFVSVELNM